MRSDHLSPKMSNELPIGQSDLFCCFKDEKTTTINVVNAQNYTRWKNHRLVFESTPLQDVFTQLNKWYNTDITCNNKELLHTPVSFILEDEPLEEVLNILQQITSFTWKQTSIQSIIIE